MLKYLKEKFTYWPKLARLASSEVQCPFDCHLLNNTEAAGINHNVTIPRDKGGRPLTRKNTRHKQTRENTQHATTKH